jgi:hypothetical protein
MDPTTLRNLQIFMIIGLFILGSITFMIGVAILVTGAWRRDLRSLTYQTTQLAQKGLTEEISGLVGNTSNLLNTLNDMVRTATGIGVFLTVSGGLLMLITCWFFLQEL